MRSVVHDQKCCGVVIAERHPCSTLFCAGFLPLFLLIGSVVAGEQASTSSERRTRAWTISSNRDPIEASYLDFRKGSVRLRKPNGDVFEVRLAELSASDKRYVVRELRTQRLAEKREKTTNQTSALPAANPQLLPSFATQTSQQQPAKQVGGEPVQLAGLQWHTSQESVRQVSQSAAEKPVPILWFRVLGDMTGFM